MSTRDRPRVLMTADTVGGVWVYAAGLAAALARTGARVHIVTMGPAPRPDQRAALAQVDGVTVEVTDLALEWMDPEGKDFARAQAQLPAIARRFAPDVVHLNGFREAAAPWRAPVLVVAHSCVRSWWQACRRGEPDEPRWTTYAENVESGLAAADRWVAPTRAFADTIEALYQPSIAGDVIHNGIEPLPAPDAKERFILAAGRLWDEAKNIALLAGIATDLPWPLRLTGPVRAPDGSTACAPGATVLGEMPRPALLATMRKAAVFAAPALYEPFGLGILEAAASGCALVLADIGTLRELWDGAAVFADPRDARGFTRALAAVCADVALRARLQQAAAARARRYRLSATTERYLDLYRAMHAGASPAAQSSLSPPAEANL